MSRFSLPDPFVGDQAQQRNNESLLSAVNQLGEFVYAGSGAPVFTPPGRALYIRTNGGAGTTLYVYEGSGWVAK